MSRAARIAIAFSPFLAGAVAVIFVPLFEQDQVYHRFADARSWLGIPNFGDVLSNAGFVIAGALGLALVPRAVLLEARERAIFAVHFAAQILTGLGSAWYHWAPDDARMIWDRLPLTAAILSFLAAVVADRVSVAAGWRLLAPLLVTGAASMAWWRATGDLRPYIVVQFAPMISIPLLVALLPGRRLRGGDFIAVLGWYALAKVCEVLDRPIFAALGGSVSGHTLKHLFAGVGAAWIVWMVARAGRETDAAPSTRST
ncbi:MAG TPA: hypothetical protein VGK61_08650 [Planctomycetota bacterium]|jgi:hypothetical protein